MCWCRAALKTGPWSIVVRLPSDPGWGRCSSQHRLQRFWSSFCGYVSQDVFRYWSSPLWNVHSTLVLWWETPRDHYARTSHNGIEPCIRILIKWIYSVFWLHQWSKRERYCFGRFGDHPLLFFYVWLAERSNSCQSWCNIGIHYLEYYVNLSSRKCCWFVWQIKLPSLKILELQNVCLICS